MRKSADIADWELTKLEACIWWCGDEECDCTQPRIERITPNRAVGYPWVHREPLFEGTFESQATRQEQAQQLRELRAAARRLGIPFRGKMQRYYGLAIEQALTR